MESWTSTNGDFTLDTLENELSEEDIWYPILETDDDGTSFVSFNGEAGAYLSKRIETNVSSIYPYTQSLHTGSQLAMKPLYLFSLDSHQHPSRRRPTAHGYRPVSSRSRRRYGTMRPIRPLPTYVACLASPNITAARRRASQQAWEGLGNIWVVRVKIGRYSSCRPSITV